MASIRTAVAVVALLALSVELAWAQDDDAAESGSSVQFAPEDETPAPAAATPAPDATTAAPQSPPPSPEAAVAPAPSPESPTPAPVAPTAAVAPAVTSEPAAPAGETLGRQRRRPEDKVFGAYRVRIALMRPKFDDGLKFYDELYGRPGWYPEIMADWFAWDWYATLGLSFRMGYYTAEGHAAKEVDKPVDDLTSDDIEPEKTSPTTLTLLPLQFLLTAEFTPFHKKWIVLDGWVGVERLYWQEVRSGLEVSEKSTTSMITADTSKKEQTDDTLTNKGWKNASVVGAAVNILLNPIDEAAASSMRGTMGIGYVYLSPFMEIVRTTSDGGVSFGRSSYGIGFTYESIN